MDRYQDRQADGLGDFGLSFRFASYAVLGWLPRHFSVFDQDWTFSNLLAEKQFPSCNAWITGS